MKHRINPPSHYFTGYRTMLMAGLVASIPMSASAADLFWDGTPTTADNASSGGAGTWDTSTGNWDDGSYNNWNNGGNDTAIFGGTAGTVTLGTDVTVGGLTFNTSNYNIAPGGGTTLTFGTSGTITNGGNTFINAIIAGGAGSTITKAGSGTLFLRGDNTFTGDLNITGGRLQLGQNNNSGRLGAGTYAGNINIATTGTGLFFNNNASQTLSGVISGTGGLQKAGSNVLVLSGNNTYTGKTIVAGAGGGGPQLSVSSFNSVVGGTASSSLGAPTTVANGTIEIGSSGNFRNSSLIYTGAGETTDRVINLRFNSSSKHTLTANGTGLLQFSEDFLITLSSGNQNGGFTLRGSGEGEIVGNIGTMRGFFEKNDAGTWTVGGDIAANRSTIRSGTLIVNGQLDATNPLGSPVNGGNATSAATGNVLVLSGATLGGTGEITGDVTVNGTLSPGNSPGVLTFMNDLTLNNGSTYDFEGDDLLRVTGELTLNDDWTLDLNSNLLDGGSITLFEYGSLAAGADLAPTFDIADLGFVPSAALSISDTGSAIVLNGVSAVPEPHTALLSALGMLFLLRRRR